MKKFLYGIILTFILATNCFSLSPAIQAVLGTTYSITPPTLSSSTIQSAGTSIVFNFSEAVSIGSGGNGGWTISSSGGAATLSYSSGDGTTDLTYTINRTINGGETGTIGYTQPTNGVEDGAGDDLASIASSAFINSSTQYLYCTACPDTTYGGDVVCEITDGSADGLCGWTDGDSVDGSTNYNVSCDNSPALGCTDINTASKCIEFTQTSTNESVAGGYKAFTGETLYAQVYVKVTAEGLGDNASFTIFSIGDSEDETNSTVVLGVKQVSSKLYFFMRYHLAAGWQADDVGGTEISLDTWYGLRLYVYNSTSSSDAIKWWADYSNNGTWTSEADLSGLTLDRANGYLKIGGWYATNTFTFQMTGLKVDDDTMPNNCLR